MTAKGSLVKKSLKVNLALELNSGVGLRGNRMTTEQNPAHYFKGNNMKYEVIRVASLNETVKA